MGLFGNFWKKGNAGLIVGDVLDMNKKYILNAKNMIDLLVHYLSIIQRLVSFIDSDKNKLKDDKLVEFVATLKKYNNLIDNEKVRVKTNKNGIFLKNLGENLSEQEKKLNNDYIINLENAKLKGGVDKLNLEKIDNLIAALNSFKGRLIVYLNN